MPAGCYLARSYATGLIGATAKKEEDIFEDQTAGKKTKKRELSNRLKKITFKVAFTFHLELLYALCQRLEKPYPVLLVPEYLPPLVPSARDVIPRPPIFYPQRPGHALIISCARPLVKSKGLTLMLSTAAKNRMERLVRGFPLIRLAPPRQLHLASRKPKSSRCLSPAYLDSYICIEGQTI